MSFNQSVGKYVIFFIIGFASCAHRSVEDNAFFFKFLNTEASIPNLTLPEYKTWLEDSAHRCISTLENDSFKVTLMYRPSNFEAANTWLNFPHQDFKTFLKEKEKYHLFVAECLDKRPATALKLKGGLAFITALSKGVFFLQNEKDTILPIIEVFPAMILNKPSHVYMLIPKDDLTSSYKACLFQPMLGTTEIITLKIDSTILSTLPKLKL